MLAASFMYGQNPPQITVSTEKVNVSGEVMYVHKVKGKETLYSIAKAYNVTIDDIVRKNGHLKAGLKEGSVIYIPSKGAAADDVLVKAAAETPAAVQETVPQVTAQQVESSAPQGWKLTPANIKKYSRKKHTVKWYEKLEDIAAKYKVLAEDIVAFNALETTQVKKKQVLYIPNNEFLAMMAQEKEVPPVQHEEKPEPAETDMAKVEYNPLDIPEDKKIELLFILPLNLRDTIAPNSSFMDFYMGALVALQNARANITLVDRQMFSSIDGIIATGVLEGKNVIVGPVKPSEIGSVLNATEGKSIVFSPMDQGGEQLVEGNPFLVQVPPAAASQQENITRLFADKCSSDKNAIVIYEKGGVDTTHLASARSVLDSAGVQYSTLSYGILEGREILEKMSGYMKPDTDNLVLVLSNSEAFVSDVVRNLNLIHTNPQEENRRNITLFGLPRWRNFERIEVDYFHRMNLHLCVPYFVDYNNEEVKGFLMKYRALVNSEPTPFAFQGYDVATAAINFNNSNIAPGMQLKHQYTRKGTGNGFINTGTRNIVYNNDYTISVME